MSRTEILSGASLASIFALRMLGRFLILPVFSIYAKTLPGGESAPRMRISSMHYFLRRLPGPITMQIGLRVGKPGQIGSTCYYNVF